MALIRVNKAAAGPSTFVEVTKGALANNGTLSGVTAGNLLIVFYSTTAPTDVSGLTLIASQDGSGGAPHCVTYSIDSDSATLTSKGGTGYIEIGLQ